MLFYVPLFRVCFTGSRCLFTLINVSFLTSLWRGKGDRHHRALAELKAFPQCMQEGKRCTHVRAAWLELARSALLLSVKGDSASADMLQMSCHHLTDADSREPPASQDAQGDRKPKASEWCRGASEVH